jgi:hypothetical protein
LEGLENRFLLYATTGMQWPKPKRITYSFVPDGTSIGGVPSNLQATLNASFATADWQAQFTKAAAVWQKVANTNFWPVSDDGTALGVSGNMQNDSRFGDIRIGGYPMSGSILAFAYLPPPANGGTSAGDMFFNTNQSWQINGTTYDLMTVAIHEFGHAIGMGHSTDSTADMYSTYTTAKQAVVTDDTSGIRSIYNSRQNDFFDANGSNDKSSQADDISSYIDSKSQLTLSALDSTTPIMIGQNDIDWYKVTVPSSTTGTMVVKMQSTHLSLLAPYLAVYDSGGTTMLGHASSTAMGDTVTVTINNVSAGQVYLIKGKGNTTGDSGFGSYGLQVNFGSQSQAAVTAPDTTMSEQADQGGGTMNESTDGSGASDAIPQDNSAIPGVPTYWVYDDGSQTISEDNGVVGSWDGSNSTDTTDSSGTDTSALGDVQVITLGDVSGIGDALMADASGEASLSRHGFGGVPPWTPAWPSLMIGVPRLATETDPQSPSLVMPLDFSFTTDLGDRIAVSTDSIAPGQVHAIASGGRATGDSGSMANGAKADDGPQAQSPIPQARASGVEQADRNDATIRETSGGLHVGDSNREDRLATGGELRWDPSALPALPGSLGHVDRTGDLSKNHRTVSPGDNAAWGRHAVTLACAQDASSWDELWRSPRWSPALTMSRTIDVFSPPYATQQDTENQLRRLFASFGNDQGVAGFTTALEAEDRKVECSLYEAVDRALDAWFPDPPN